MNKQAVDFLKSKYREFKVEPSGSQEIAAPSLHIVLGSGLGGAIDEAHPKAEWDVIGEIPFASVPGLFATTVPGHAGIFRYFKNRKDGQVVCFQVGRIHGYEGHTPREVVMPVMNARMAGTKNFILTNAAGSLKREFEIGSVMLIRDHINLTGNNPQVGENPKFDGKHVGPRFNDMSKSYNREMTAVMRDVFGSRKFQVNEGIYLGLLGPSFETPAEVALFARWGLDAVGMSTVWENIALNHSGARVAGVSFISNLGCGLTDAPLDHEDVLRETSKAAAAVVEALFGIAARKL